MCGRYTVLTEDEIINIRGILQSLSLLIVKDDFTEESAAYGVEGEVFPSNLAPVITMNSAGISLERMKWGFGKWNSPGVIINARSETISTKSIFSKHLLFGRCVVPAGEFFEWAKLGKGKKKHCAKDRDGNPLFMAGLCRDIKDNANLNGILREFVIITKDAAGEMTKVHDRMPVILRQEQIEDWLTGEIAPEDIVKMDFDVKVVPLEDENPQLSFFR